MSLKNVLEAQKSGELDLLPGSAFTEICPLTIDGAFAYVMHDGTEWYEADIDYRLIAEALELVGIDIASVQIYDTKVVSLKTNLVLYEGEDLADLFGEIVSDAGIKVEFS